MKSADLHTMARRYLTDRNQELHGQYAALPDEGRKRWGYTVEAKRIFPRYNLVAAMLVEVERLDPDDLPEPLATALVAAAETAHVATFGRTEAKAAGEERELFLSAVRLWENQELAVEPLGYRRVLTAEESAAWRVRVEDRWGLGETYWHPLLDEDVPDDVLVLRAESMWDGPGVRLVREALAGLGRRRVIELREPGDPDVEVDVELFEPTYTFAEGVWVDETLDWIAYASHESTVAFGGVLADLLRAGLAEYADWQRDRL